MGKMQNRFFPRLFAVLLLGLCLALVPRAASAEKTDWTDNSYDFSKVKRVMVHEVDFTEAQISSSLKARNYTQNFFDYAKKMGCEVVTYEQFLRRISLLAGVDIEKLMDTDPERAQALLSQYKAQVVDAWIYSRAAVWANDFYIEPERTVWETRRISAGFRGTTAAWSEQYYYVTVPVTYPARRVDYSRLNMAFEVYDAKTGQMIFGREDARDREGYDQHDGMYERICKSFFSDFGNKINN